MLEKRLSFATLLIMKLFGWGGKDKNGKKNRLPASLQDENQRFKVIIDNIEDGVLLIDDQGVIQLINPGGASLCGWTVEEATGVDAKAVLKLVNDKGVEVSQDDNPLDRVFVSDQTVKASDIFLMTREKKQIPLRLVVSPLITGHDKEVTAAVAVFSDITEEKAAEQQRADFISTASHEMRTPVAAIEGYLALALNDKVSTIDSRARGYIDKAHASTQHLGQLFQDLLTSAKAEDGRLTSHPVVIEMGDFLEQLTSDLRLVAEKKGLAMEFTAGNVHNVDATKEGSQRVVRPLYYALADPDRLREVITNLFDNAVKYTPEGKVTVGLTGNDQVVQCFVRDTGPGIPAADLPHLFQKFYRVDNSATRTVGGTGLGLFISRKIIELYNGRIWAESEMGKGSTFYINLPRLSPQRAKELQATNVNPAVVKPVNTEGAA